MAAQEATFTQRLLRRSVRHGVVVRTNLPVPCLHFLARSSWQQSLEPVAQRRSLRALPLTATAPPRPAREGHGGGRLASAGARPAAVPACAHAGGAAGTKKSTSSPRT